MKNKMKGVLTALSLAALLVAALSCKVEEPEAAADTTAPAVVTNVNAQAGDKQVVLTWSDPADTDLYGVRVSYTSAGGASGNIRAAFADGVLVAKGAQTYIVTGLTNGTEYTFSVYAVDTSQNESSAVTAAATPADSSDKIAPANVDTSTVTATCGNGTVLLSWTNPADSDLFGVEVTASAGGTTAWDSMVINGGKSLLVSGLTNGTEYTFTFKSYDKSLNASNGTTIVATPVDTADSTAPAEASSFAAAAGDGAVVLTWENPTDSDYYCVKITASPAEGTLANALMTQGSALSVSGLTNGTQYTFKIQTMDTSLNASAGTTATAKPADSSDHTAPANVDTSTVTATCGNGTVLLNWTNPADNDLFGVEVTASAGGTTAWDSMVVNGGKSLLVSGLTNGTEYTFTLKSYDKSLNASNGTTIVATPVDTADSTAPAEASSFAAVAGDACATLSWTEPSDSDYYGVKISATPAAGTLASPVVLLKGTTSLSVTGLTNGTQYTFTAQTLDTSLNASAGTTAAATPVDSGDTTPPANVTNLTATNKDAAVLLTWTDAADSDVYGYEVGWNGTGAINRAALTAISTGSMMVAPGAGGCYISNLTNGTSYTFTVKSVDTSGNKSTGVTSDAITPSIIEQSPLSIACAASTTAATNQNVTVTVSVSTAAGSSIKKVAYITGTSYSAATVISSGTALTADTNGKYTFTVSANGSFTAAALDTAGREECAYITVSNIDKTAPAKVTNLAAGYSSTGGTLTVTWTKPADSDLHHYSFLCTDTTNSGATVKSIDSVDAATTKETLTAAADSIVEGHTYSITVYAYDTVGNKSEAATASFATAATAAYTGITVYRTNYTGTNTLARTHLDTAMSDRSMTAVLTGSNLSKANGLVIKSINESDGTSTSISTAASSSDTEIVYTFDAPAAAATYSVYPYDGDNGASGVSAPFTVTAPAAVTKVSLATAQFAKGTSGREVTATITGTNLDIRGVTTVQVLDSAGTQSGDIVTIGDTQTSATTLTVDVPVPSDEGHYTVQVYFDGTASGTAATLWVYGTPAVASVYIPTCGTKPASGTTVPVTISGTNFSGVAGVTNTITVKNGTEAAVMAAISSATSATASISIPSTAGDYPVTVYINGTESAVTGTLTVLDEAGYDKGDVLLDKTKSKPVAVLYYDTYGGPYGLGLQQSSLAWAPSSSAGYSTNFTAIQSSRSGSSGSYTFTGDTDGSDNWEEVCKVDSTASTTAATNYPAFSYANTYGSTYCSDTSFTSGWYLPSLAELYALYKNRTALDNGLAAAGGTKFSNSSYWSSSQYSNSYGYAWDVSFSNGYVYGGYKTNYRGVRVIRAFNNLTDLTIASPTVTSVAEIPACSTTGGTVPVTVYGAYLNASSDTVTVNCNGTDYTATINSGTSAIATVAIPTTAGSYPVTVKLNGTEKLTSTLVCKTYDSATYAVGNILCSDGSVVTKAAFNSSTMTAVAVICGGTNAGGAPLAVGLGESSSLQWAPSGTTGYSTNITAIVCTPSATGSGAASTATFTGDTYGGDNWDAVCAVDGTASANAAANYPAFNYANTYTATNYTSGWYVPSVSELCTLYRNMTAVNESLTAAGGTQIGTDWYWSSSQYSNFYNYAWNVNFSNGDVDYYTKGSSGYVRVIRAF